MFKAEIVAGLIALGGFSLGAQAMTLISPTIENGKSLQNAQIYNGWGCTGKNESPALKWSDVPKGTKSFAVTMYDPDAPTGSGWWHWVVVNIPADVRSLPENAGVKDSKKLPQGAIQLRNDFGYNGFGGACPPEGSKPHNYQITVYALNTSKLDIPPMLPLHTLVFSFFNIKSERLV
jgi:Raf kinase inhibitor-like YbhB/YbcL family protein